MATVASTVVTAGRARRRERLMATGQLIVHVAKEPVIRESDGALCALVETMTASGKLLGLNVVVAGEGR